MGYKVLGFVVWQGSKWYLRRRMGGAKRKVALAGSQTKRSMTLPSSGTASATLVSAPSIALSSQLRCGGVKASGPGPGARQVQRR